MKNKKVKGFTLVELIVVIAIIGILAAILIPTLSGKIKNSRLATANNNAQEIFKSQQQASMLMTDEMLSDMGSQASYQQKGPKLLQDQYDELLNINPSLCPNAGELASQMCPQKDGYFGAVYDKDGYPLAVVWSSSNASDAIVGRYPDVPKNLGIVTWANWYDNYEFAGHTT